MNQTLIAAFDRIQRTALIVGIVGLVLCVIGLFINSSTTLQSYLFGYIFWIGLSLGCLGLLMIQFIVKGTWGLVIRRLLEAGAVTIPLMAVLFIPILLSMNTLYPWAQADVVANSPVLQQKSVYLNIPFFFIRAVIYFALWSALVYVLRRWSHRQDSENSRAIFQRLQSLSILGAIVLTLTMTFAMIDWIMSLEPEWSSTIYSLMIAAGGILGAFALVIALLTLLRAQEPLIGVVTPPLLNDLGNLLMSALLMWAYMAFSQYLVIWTGNLSDEIPWYLKRLDGGWQSIILVVVVLHFIIPFILLLSPNMKRNARLLGLIAFLILVMHLVDTFWLVIPDLRLNGVAFSWTDIAAPIGIGGLWVAAFLWQLKQSPLLARDPEIELPSNQEAAANG